MSASSSSSCSLTYLRPEVVALKQTLDDFVDRECIPAEASYEAHLAQFHGADRFTEAAIPPVMKSLKKKAQDLGLWNLFIPPHLIQQIPDSVRSMYAPHIPLSIREYGIVCESMGRSFLAPEACNTSAPDTGNMEVLLEFGTPQQKQRYLIPLLAGTIRSTFLMTEPDVASSDPTNLQTTLTPTLATNNKNKNHHSYILQGRKWWSTGALHPHCRFAIVVARVVGPEATEEDSPQDYPHPTTGSTVDPHGNLFAIVIVPIPQSSKSSSSKIRIVRALECLGEDDAPSGHAEIVLDRVVVNAETDWIRGSGFRIAQARLGPGRIHHCMRAVGIASRCYELMLQRSLERKTFGKILCQHGGVQEMIADSFADLNTARLLTLACAHAMDEERNHGQSGSESSRRLIACIKVRVPALTYAVVDRAVQLFGGEGVQHSVLSRSLRGLRALRIADGPDAVHQRTVARLEIRRTLRTNPPTKSQPHHSRL